MSMKTLSRIIYLSALLLTTACVQAGVAAVNLPTHFDSIKRSTAVSFGPEAWQKLDIYAPPNATDAPLDVIVFYYGGRWETGAKEDYRFVGSALAKQNFVVVIPDYRKYPDVKFPAFVQDSAKSLAWVSDHIAEYGGNPAHIHISGHSAGAHIASLLATDKRYLKAEGKDRSIIRSFAGLAGPYDFTPDEKDLMDMFGPPDKYPQMQATTFVDGHQPPMLLLYGDADTVVKKYNMDRLVQAIHAKGGCVETKIYPGVSHMWIVAALSWVGSSKAPVAQDMAAFFHKNDTAKTCNAGK